MLHRVWWFVVVVACWSLQSYSTYTVGVGIVVHVIVETVTVWVKILLLWEVGGAK